MDAHTLKDHATSHISSQIGNIQLQRIMSDQIRIARFSYFQGDPDRGQGAMAPKLITEIFSPATLLLCYHYH